jgi:hypothetical protein
VNVKDDVVINLIKPGPPFPVTRTVIFFLPFLKKNYFYMNAAGTFPLLLIVRRICFERPCNQKKEEYMRDVSVHDFHFMSTREMKDKLRDLNVFKGVRSVSGVIVRILEVLTPVIGKELKWGEQRMSRYRNVCDNPEAVREDVHVYVPQGLYRELKMLHHGLNFYSIAQFVRELIECFLGFVEGCQGDVLSELERLFASWREEKELSRLTLKEYMRQLFTIIRHLPGKNRLITIYNQQYSPFWVLRV